MKIHKRHPIAGFTLVELLIVVAVIGILAAITIVGYGSWRQNTAANVLKSDLNGASSAMEDARNWGSGYPSSVPSSFNPSSGTTLTGGSSDGKTFCIQATNAAYPTLVFHVSNGGSVTAGACPIVIANGSSMQTVTSSNCPVTPTRVVDTRDSHTYWVEQLGDGKCWMLTNLAYAGGGTNTYGDVDTLANGTGGAMTYTTASYYVVPSTTNYTTEPTAPSTSTSGSGQYGYLYNWCGAMGNQQSTGACNGSSMTPTPSANASVCPAGWRLPVGNGGEFDALNTAANSGSTTTSLGLLSNWLGQWSGDWSTTFNNQGSRGEYWSNTQASAAGAYFFQYTSANVYTVVSTLKNVGFAVRCVAI